MLPSPESLNYCPFWVLSRDKLTYNSPYSINPRGKGSKCNKFPSYLPLIDTTSSVIKHVPSYKMSATG